jgi:hypothetical protein
MDRASRARLSLQPRIVSRPSLLEKAGVQLAAKLRLDGCLRNSLVTVASAPWLLEMIGECVPALYVAFNAALASLDGRCEWGAFEELYSNMEICRFSQEVLSRCPPGLAVQRVAGFAQHDLGQVHPPQILGKSLWSAQAPAARY